ncbi:Dps family protein [Flavobacterium sp. DG2-3]|uniref:Dps family protein n=1 Tax=Flavobacterium sp. DG2-3 TaxID=3068317 RepID=UPI00273F9C5F|nr:DNA starvation/stationary phase protection protein [Flavobacterium sp. DG2-3]MDP5200286.1 DNA starvation/stationary phase protection protein [Flavobacterium sp. DG2-3]
MKTNIGISENNRQNAALELSKILADESVLHTKTKQAHWNIEGNDFYDKHKLFDEQANQIAETIDTVAERIRTLGHLVPATLKAFLELSRLTENVPTENDSQSLISELLSAHETIITHLRADINLFDNDYEDLGTSDFITGLMQEHEKTAWILRAHLKK